MKLFILEEQTQYDNQRRQQAAATQQQQQARANFLVRTTAAGNQAQPAQYYFTQVRNVLLQLILCFVCSSLPERVSP